MAHTLSYDVAEEIRSLLASGDSREELAILYDVSYACIRNIDIGKSWKRPDPWDRPQDDELNSAWKGKKAGTKAKHNRVRRRRGLASEHSCVSCIETDVKRRADQWARIHSETGDDPWSDYVALCNGCHSHYDRFTKHHPKRLFNAMQVATIREALELGIPVERIAKILGVSRTPIRGINEGRSYRDV